MILAAIAAALAAPVRCDPGEAASILREARIAEHRAPISHPELVPGLALASPHTRPALSDALTEFCAGQPDLSLVPGESWQAGEWAAHTFLLTRTDAEGCALATRTLAISVGLPADGVPVYDLRDASEPRPALAPLGDCDTPPQWTEERTLGGEGSPTRLLLVTEHDPDGITGSRVIVRRATESGWHDEHIAEPAPPRLLDPSAEGPRLALTEIGERWIVETQARTFEKGGCRAVPGQRLWRPTENGWERVDGLVALRSLASRGLWRYAGEDGWIAVVAQDDEEDRALVEARVRRLARRNNKELLLLRSSWFPELNPGFVVAVLGPYGSEHEAKVALKGYRGGARRYVKRAWTAVDPCVEVKDALEPSAPRAADEDGGADSASP